MTEQRILIIRWHSIVVMLLAALLCSGGIAPCVAGQAPPEALKQSEVRLVNSDSEMIDGPFAGMLLIPKDRPIYRDEKYQKPYTLACHVYTAVPGTEGRETTYKRRFLVCAADPDSLEFTKSVAKLLLLLYGERHDRLHDDHSLNNPTVNVWLTERVEAGLSPDTGGEQFQNQIYLYNIHNPRSEVEWAREIAHEYGHYALPGVCGFTEPEEWANGVLGERLFLKWIRDDLRSGRLKPEQIPFVSPGNLDDYYTRAIWPLVRRIMRDGMNAQLITSGTTAGMNYYTGLVMYIDTLYGTPALLNAMLDTRSASKLAFARASDFLTGMRASLRDEKELTLTLPAIGNAEKEQTITIYLPAGKWTASMQGSALSWRIENNTKTGLTCTGNAITARKSGWHNLTYFRSADGAAARLVLRRRG